jgi:hypothetical protein
MVRILSLTFETRSNLRGDIPRLPLLGVDAAIVLERNEAVRGDSVRKKLPATWRISPQPVQVKAGLLPVIFHFTYFLSNL